MKKKILYILTKADLGGAKKYVHDLTFNLDPERFETKTLYGGKDIKWLSNKVYPLGLFFNDWLAITELIKILKREQPDVIHLNSSKAGVIGSLAAFLYNFSAKLFHSKTPQLRTIFTAHGWVFNPTNYLPLPIRYSYRLFHKFAGLFQDAIINVSKYDLEIALRYKIAPEHKLIAIHNGIDPNINFLDKKTARQAIIRKLKPANQITNQLMHSIWIGSIGRLTKEKNYETLIAAASKVKEANFLIIGSGPELNHYQSLISYYQLEHRFFIIDPTGNDAQYLKAFDVFVLSSVKEGLPYSLLEAMAASLPIVVSDAGGMPEAVQNGKTGIIVPKKQPHTMQAALANLLNDAEMRKKISAAARERALADFNLSRMVVETKNIYEQR